MAGATRAEGTVGETGAAICGAERGGESEGAAGGQACVSEQTGRTGQEEPLAAAFCKMRDSGVGCLREAQAAVDVEGLAGDEVRTGGKEEHRLGNFFSRTIAAHGCFCGEANGFGTRSSGN